MQFLIISTLLATLALADVTKTKVSTTVATITSCGPEVTYCPGRNTTYNSTISTYQGGANKAQFGVAGLVAAGALLAL